MLDLFHFLVDYQLWIYAILGILALLYLGRLVSAWRERYTTIFGLEREDAQRRLNSALAIFILLVLLIGAEFVIVTFVVPEWPLVMLTAAPEQEEEIMITPPGEGGLNIISTPEGASANPSAPIALTGCVPGQLEWLEPRTGDVIDGSFTLRATVNVQDMAWFNWAYASVTDPDNWQTLSAGNLPVIEGDLGLWATSQVSNGDYTLRLTVYDLSNQELAPCDIHIRVLNDTD